MWLDLQGHQDRRYCLSSLADLREWLRQNSHPQLSPELPYFLSSGIRLSCWPLPLLLTHSILKISFPTMIMPNLKDEGSFLLALPFRKQLVGTELRGCVGWGLYYTGAVSWQSGSTRLGKFSGSHIM